MHPENPLTEQRICDQQRLIKRKANTRENTRGSWLTEMVIGETERTIIREIEGEANVPAANNEINDQSAQNIQPENPEPTATEIGPEIPQNNHRNEELETIRDLITTIILKHQSHQWNTDSLWKKSS